jgi:hypothetical protein
MISMAILFVYGRLHPKDYFLICSLFNSEMDKIPAGKSIESSGDYVQVLGVLIYQKEQMITETRYFGEHANLGVRGHTYFKLG